MQNPARRAIATLVARAGQPIEVVSEFELRAALAEGFAPQNIFINGPAKHHWLSRHELRDLAVNFDSPAELAALLPLAKKLNWRCGVRLNTSEEFDPENPQFPRNLVSRRMKPWPR